MSDSEEDSSFCSSNSLCSPLKTAISTALNMAPVNYNLDLIRSQITSLKSPCASTSQILLNNPTVLRSGKKTDAEKNLIIEAVQSIKNEVHTSYERMDKMLEIMLLILDKMDNQENRIQALENKISSAVNSYASMAASNSSTAPGTNVSESRINRLEYTTSEQERNKRLLQITVKHPQLNSSSLDLAEHSRNFFRSKLKMPNREIDANLIARKSPKDNKVIITFSDKRFKTFIFKARKKIRDKNQEETDGLFINDHLTTFNYKLLNDLKSERTRRSNEGLPNYEVIYTFNGRIFIKKNKGAPNDDAILIKNHTDYMNLLQSLNPANSSTTALSE